MMVRPAACTFEGGRDAQARCTLAPPTAQAHPHARPPTHPAAPAGYLTGCTVYADINGNQVLDSADPQASVIAGVFTFASNVTASQLKSGRLYVVPAAESQNKVQGLGVADWGCRLRVRVARGWAGGLRQGLSFRTFHALHQPIPQVSAGAAVCHDSSSLL